MHAPVEVDEAQGRAGVLGFEHEHRRAALEAGELRADRRRAQLAAELQSAQLAVPDARLDVRRGQRLVVEAGKNVRSDLELDVLRVFLFLGLPPRTAASPRRGETPD